MYGKKLSAMQKRMRIAVVQISTKRTTMVINVINVNKQIEQNQQRSSSSNTFSLSDFLFYIHWLGRNLDNIDILIM